MLEDFLQEDFLQEAFFLVGLFVAWPLELGFDTARQKDSQHLNS